MGAMPDIQPLIEQMYDYFYLARAGELPRGFDKKRMVPRILSMIQRKYKSFTAVELKAAIIKGSDGDYDDNFNRSKGFDVPTINRYLSFYNENEHRVKLAKDKAKIDYVSFKDDLPSDGQISKLAVWWFGFLAKSRRRGALGEVDTPYSQQEFEKDKKYLKGVNKIKLDFLIVKMKESRPGHRLTEYLIK